MLRNFTLSKDFIKQAVKQFTRRKTMEVIHEVLGPNPHRKEDMLPLLIVGPHSEGVAKEGATGSVDERGALETAQGNPYNSVGTPTVYVLPSDGSSKEEEEGAGKTHGPYLRDLTFPLKRKRKG